MDTIVFTLLVGFAVIDATAIPTTVRWLVRPPTSVFSAQPQFRRLRAARTAFLGAEICVAGCVGDGTVAQKAEEVG